MQPRLFRQAGSRGGERCWVAYSSTCAIAESLPNCSTILTRLLWSWDDNFPARVGGRGDRV